MSQCQSGLNASCREHRVPPHKLSLRAMKAELYKLRVPNLLSAKVCVALLTPSQLPSNALEQYYKLSVKSRVNGYWSGCNGVHERNILSPKHRKDSERRAGDMQCHRRISHVDLQMSPRTANRSLQEKVSSSPNTNKQPVTDLASAASKAEQTPGNSTCIATARVYITPLSPELAFKTLTSFKQSTKPSIPVRRSTKIYQATRPSTPFRQAVSTSASVQPNVLCAHVPLTPYDSDTHLTTSLTAARSLTSTNTAVKQSSTILPVAGKPVQISKAFLDMPSLNVCLSPISPDLQKVNHAISPASSPDRLRTSVCTSSGPVLSATSTIRFEQPFLSTPPGKLHSVVPLKTKYLTDQPGSSESKSRTLPSGGKVCSSVASVCLSPLRPDQLPSNARKQYEEQSVKQGTPKCVASKKEPKTSTEVKRKALQKKHNGKTFTVDKKTSPPLKRVRSMMNKNDLSRMCKKQKAPLQTIKDNLQPFGVQKQKERCTKRGRAIPNYIEVITETDSSDSDEDENQPLAYLIDKKNKEISRTLATNKPEAKKSTKGVKRKAELGDQVRKKSRKNLNGRSVNCERKPKTASVRKYRIPARYYKIKFSEVSDITRIKTRYRVAFSRWPHVFGGALDVINQRLASQNAIWNCL